MGARRAFHALASHHARCVHTQEERCAGKGGQSTPERSPLSLVGRGGGEGPFHQPATSQSHRRHRPVADITPFVDTRKYEMVVDDAAPRVGGALEAAAIECFDTETTTSTDVPRGHTRSDKAGEAPKYATHRYGERAAKLPPTSARAVRPGSRSHEEKVGRNEVAVGDRHYGSGAGVTRHVAESSVLRETSAHMDALARASSARRPAQYPTSRQGAPITSTRWSAAPTDYSPSRRLDAAIPRRAWPEGGQDAGSSTHSGSRSGVGRAARMTQGSAIAGSSSPAGQELGQKCST